MDDLVKAAIDAYDKADIKTEDEPTTSKATLLSEERETAIRNHDHAKLAEMDKKFETDMHAIQTTIDQFGEAAFNCITDEHGREIHLCSNESGVFWVHVKQEGGATPDEASASANTPNEEVHMNTTMEVGYMSKNSGQALLSWTRWEKAIPHLAIAGFAAGVGAIIGSRMFAAIMKSEARQVLEAGVAREVARKAVAELEEKGASEAEKVAARAAYRTARRNVDKIWLKSLPKGTAVEKILNFAAKWPKLTSFLGGFIATVIIEVALELLLPLVNKDYFVQVHVLNFDKKDWKIDDWSHDNGIIAGGDTWSVKTMEAGRSEVQTPWGTKIGKWKNINNITYCFQNSFTLMDGIGLALRAVQTDGKAGFAMAYLCKFWTANRLTVKPGYPPSIKDFYDDNNNWPSDRELKYACEVTREDGEKVKIVGSTNALSKVENNIYHFYVTIGA